MHHANILIQGPRDAGKTHLLRKIIDRFGDEYRMAGFFTEKTGGVVRFRAWDNFEFMDNGPSDTLYDERDRLVRTSVFEELGVWSINRAVDKADLMIFDELGRFEQGCDGFVHAVKEALDHKKLVIAAIKMERNSFLDALRGRKDTLLFTINPLNREQMYEDALRWIEGSLPMD